MNEEQFRAFYEESGPALVGQLYAMIGDAAEAQDCVQEAFIKAWTHRENLETQGNPTAWVRTTAYRLSVSRWRRASSLLRAYQRHGATPHVEPPNELSSDVAAAMRQLPLPLRQVLVLHYLCDLPLEEIASETGLALGTVKSRLHRAREQMALVMGPEHRPNLAVRTLPTACAF